MGWRDVTPFHRVAPTGRPNVRGSPSRLGAWIVVAALVALAGVACAMLVARSVSRTDAETSRQAFARTSSQIASTLSLAIAREGDLAVNAGALYLRDPNASPLTV